MQSKVMFFDDDDDDDDDRDGNRVSYVLFISRRY